MGSVATAGIPDNDSRTPDLAVVVVLGATATGKTGLAIRLAGELGGEVISADSRYFYRGMDIGTAKPTLAERGDIPHHLIDIRDPEDAYSLASFLDDAYAAIEGVAARRRLPIVAGGTPQYLRALLEGWRVPAVEPDDELRVRLDVVPVELLYERLLEVDPASAERIGPANKRRMIRALEVFEKTGKPMSEIAGQSKPPYRFVTTGLFQDREALYARIDARVADMFASGWLDEVRSLRERGISRAMPSMSAHGYREALDVIDGLETLDGAITRTRAMIHRYVRHQSTWFRRFEGVTWIDSARPGFEDVALRVVRDLLAAPTGSAF